MGATIGWFIIAGIVGLVIWGWITRKSGKTIHPSLSSQPVGVPHMEGDGSFEFDIVGEASYQDALSLIAGGKTDASQELERLATLVREPRNVHDANAIAITIEGRKVGYVARKEARAISQMMDRRGYSQFTADALIVGGWDRGRRGQANFGVKLDLPV